MRVIKGLVAVLCLAVFSAASAQAQDMPLLGGVVNYVAAKGRVLVNGIPVAHFNVDKDGSGGTSMQLTEWLRDGENEIVLEVEPTGERAKAELKVQDFHSSETRLTLNQTGVGTTSGTLTASGIPAWAWEKSEARAEADGLADAMANLHAAYASHDVEAVIHIVAPFFADQKILGGLSADMFRERIGAMLTSGKLKPIGELRITRHLNGKLFRAVTADGGQPPIRIELEEDGLKNTLKMGEWWSVIGGQWRVVR